MFYYIKRCFFLLNNFFNRYIFLIKIIFIKDKLNIYTFGLRQRYLGVQIFLNGYKNKNIERNVKIDENYESVFINNLKLIVPCDFFKKGELLHLYNEVFIEFKKNSHAYEDDFIFIKPGDVVFDVGACEGFFGLYALNKKASMVYLIEPMNILCDALKKTFEKEILLNKVVIENKGFLNKNGFLGFNTDVEYKCMANFDEKCCDKVESITLDKYVFDNKLDRVDFIKMDIEGAEILAIEGSINTIKKFKPKISIAVYHGYENAFLIKDLLLKIYPDYKINFGGCYMFEKPYRPYMLYAY